MRYFSSYISRRAATAERDIIKMLDNSIGVDCRIYKQLKIAIWWLMLSGSQNVTLEICGLAKMSDLSSVISQTLSPRNRRAVLV